MVFPPFQTKRNIEEKIAKQNSEAPPFSLRKKQYVSILLNPTNYPFNHKCLIIYGMKTNWCHYFIRIFLDLYMFRAHRPIFKRVRTAVHTTIGSVSVPLCSRARGTDTEPMVVWTAVQTLLKMGLWAPKHVEIQQYTNKIVTSVGFHSTCWKDARYKKKLKKFIYFLFILNNVIEFDLLRLKHIRDTSKYTTYLYMVKCAISWIEYCILSL